MGPDTLQYPQGKALPNNNQFVSRIKNIIIESKNMRHMNISDMYLLLLLVLLYFININYIKSIDLENKIRNRLYSSWM
jgi:hypothetical protein